MAPVARGLDEPGQAAAPTVDVVAQARRLNRLPAHVVPTGGRSRFWPGISKYKKRGDMKILISVLMGMLRNVSLSCWSVSDR